MVDRSYVVREGDYLREIARRFGFDPSAVWNDAKNAPVREKRSDPDQLVAGDVLFFPETERAWHRLKVGEVNAFVASDPPVQVSVRFMSGGEPLASEPYTIEGVDVPPGQTDGDGFVRCAVPMRTKVLRVCFTARREVHTVKVGHLDPADVPSGAAQRLTSLGFHGRAAGMDPSLLTEQELRHALRAFQVAHQLPGTGDLDAPTSAKLVATYGS